MTRVTVKRGISPHPARGPTKTVIHCDRKSLRSYSRFPLVRFAGPPFDIALGDLDRAFGLARPRTISADSSVDCADQRRAARAHLHRPRPGRAPAFGRRRSFLAARGERGRRDEPDRLRTDRGEHGRCARGGSPGRRIARLLDQGREDARSAEFGPLRRSRGRLDRRRCGRRPLYVRIPDRSRRRRRRARRHVRASIRTAGRRLSKLR